MNFACVGLASLCRIKEKTMTHPMTWPGCLTGLVARNSDGTEKHTIEEGSRQHVISYYLQGGKGVMRCSEPNCEVNARERSKP